MVRTIIEPLKEAFPLVVKAAILYGQSNTFDVHFDGSVDILRGKSSSRLTPITFLSPDFHKSYREVFIFLSINSTISYIYISDFRIIRTYRAMSLRSLRAVLTPLL